MFARFLFPILLLIFTCADAATKPLLDIQHWKTANGARVYYVSAPEIPMVEINVVFDAGSARDNTQPGLAQFTNAMLNEGTKTHSAEQIAEKFDDVGAQFSSSTSRDMSTVSLQSLTASQYLDPAVQIFSEVLMTANFPQDAFTRVQKQILNALTQQQQTPSAIAKNAFFAAVYKDNPYGHPTLGTPDSIMGLTIPALSQFYKKYYVAQNAIITIVGAVNRPQAETIANKIMSGLPTGEAAQQLPANPQVNQASKQQIAFPSQQTNILIGQVGINHQDPNFFPFMVGNYMLGGSPLTSRLFNEVREKRGLAYSVGSTFVPLAAKGPFLIVLQTRNGEAEQSLKIVNETLDHFIKQAPSDLDVSNTKKKIINSFPLTLAGTDNISNNLITIGFYHLPLNYLDTYREKIAAVTPTQIQQAFGKTVYPNKMVTIMVGNHNS